MAKTSKKEVEKTEVIQETVQEEVKPKKEIKKSVENQETVPQEQLSEAEIAYQKYMEKRRQMKKFVTKTVTPYLSSPNKLNNVAGFIPKNTVCYIEEEIDDVEKGNFYKVANDKYVNKQWEVEML